MQKSHGKKKHLPSAPHRDDEFQNPPHSLLAVIMHGDAVGPYNARDTSGVMNQTLVSYS